MNLNDRGDLDALRRMVDAALEKIGNEHDLSFQMGHITFDTNGKYARFKIEVGRVNADGTVETKESKAFALHAPLHGVDASWLGQTFESRGETFRVTGWNTRAHKMPVQAERVRDGRGFKFGASTLRNRTPQSA